MSIFPFIDHTDATGSDASDTLPALKEYAYDFEKNELLLDEGGNTYMVTGNEALRIWILKALATERFHYTAYSFGFGTEWQDQLVGSSMDMDVLKLELERYIVEALMVNPYIKRLDNFSFEATSMGMTVTFECTSIYGTDKIPVPIREVKI
ncbi:MAG: DUF2634 domain-containing protein [Lachnospiraceae bacterium]|nr:DUF2634 domain-containing protein [Lachnospiraceae bacterium]MCM1240968.1 DUF2634 domain-containing protein [Lachnospiraceae bacterium]